MATSVSSDVKDSSVYEKQVQDIEKGGESVEQIRYETGGGKLQGSSNSPS